MNLKCTIGLHDFGSWRRKVKASTRQFRRCNRCGKIEARDAPVKVAKIKPPKDAA